MKGIGPIEFSPWLLSVLFGVWILVMSGLAGFYVPANPSTASTSTSKPALGPASAATPSVAELSPTVSPQKPPAAAATVAAPLPLVRTPSPPSPPTATPPPSPTPAARIHVVGRGDTLSEIADKYGISVQALMKANDMTDPDKLSEGDKLKLP